LTFKSHFRPLEQLVLDRVGPHSLVSLGLVRDFADCYLPSLLESRYDLRGKTMIDVGCDEGTTPLLWRALGASKVIGYECNKRFVWRMKRLRREPWFDFRGKWEGELPKGDFLKVDVEGYESRLDLEALKSYEFWFLALHHHTLLYPEASTYYLEPEVVKMGGKFIFEHHTGKERVFVGGRALKQEWSEQ
jgi:hypothetical protein